MARVSQTSAVHKAVRHDPAINPLSENPAIRCVLNFAFDVCAVVRLFRLHEFCWRRRRGSRARPLMSAVHGLYARWRRIFERDGNNRTANFYRFWNEVPTILFLIIVPMAVAKPF